jgi:hypothetical protein
MAADERQRLLAEEADWWREKSPEAYDQAVATLVDGLGGGPSTDLDALVELAEAILKRRDPALVLSRGRLAIALAVAFQGATERQRRRIASLVVAAAAQLRALADAGPTTIAAAPELPPGVLLPAGADPDLITDPRLRELADEAAAVHRRAVVRWTAKQRAIGQRQELRALLDSLPDLPPGLRAELFDDR